MVCVTPIAIITDEQMVWTDKCTLITICLRLHTFVELLYEVECVEPQQLLQAIVLATAAIYIAAVHATSQMQQVIYTGMYVEVEVS